MSTENVVVASGSTEQVNRVIEPSFTGEAITLDECVKLAAKSKVTTLKIVRDAKVAIVGKVVSGKRGRPANLYDRDAFTKALADFKE